MSVKMFCGYRTEPFWKERCGQGGYLFSFKSFYTGTAPDEKLDVYCWTNGSRQEFCLRYGDEDHEYHSPGGIENIISLSQYEPYSTCLALLREHGNIVYQPNEDA